MDDDEQNPDMALSIREENRRLPVNKDILRQVSMRTFRVTRNEPADISLVACDDTFITHLNEKYRGRSGPTDVLSFSMREGDFSEIGSALLGDIVISVETAERQATEAKRTLEEEFLFLYIHGLLHLLGYTHNSREQETIMTECAQKIAAGVRIK